MAKLTFFFDFISPYAYLAWKAAPAVSARHGLELEPVPILFAGLLNHHGQKGPAEIGPKRTYTFKQILRLAHDASLSVAPPPSHPFNPLLALRMASLELEAEPRIQLIEALFAATWAGGNGVESPEAIQTALEGSGLDAATLLERAIQPANKDRLKAFTARAIEAGVFGVPTFSHEGELFWGYDSIAHLERYLRGEDPLPHDLLDRWEHLPATAQRVR